MMSTSLRQTARLDWNVVCVQRTQAKSLLIFILEVATDFMTKKETEESTVKSSNGGQQVKKVGKFQLRRTLSSGSQVTTTLRGKSRLNSLLNIPFINYMDIQV